MDNGKNNAARQQGERLESWKAIASYLNRSLRTVRRWEATEGLPVYRHKHHKGSTVIAYKSELDAWREARLIADQRLARSSLEAVPGHRTTRRQPWWRQPRKLLGFLVVIAVAGALTKLRDDNHESSSLSASIPPQRISLLVTDFDNRTDDPAFDLPFQELVTASTTDLPFVEIVDQGRVERVLRLMRKPDETPLNARVAREVSLRDGRIQGIVTGRAQRLGREHIVSIELVDPVRGVGIAHVAESIRSPDELDRARRRLTRGFSQAVSDHRRSTWQPAPNFAHVTTSSLHALRLYTKAETFLEHDKVAPARVLLRQAIEMDPQFASAYAQLAWAMRNAGYDSEQYHTPAKQGFRLLPLASEQERLFIRSSYYHLLGLPAEARASYQALLSIYPDHYWGIRRALDLCLDRSSEADCVEYRIRLAELRPHDLRANIAAARALVVSTRGAESAASYASKAAQLLSPDTIRAYPHAAIQTHLFPIYTAWIHGCSARCLGHLERLERSAHRWPAAVQEAFARAVGDLYLSIGRLNTAAEWFARISVAEVRRERLARVIFMQGRMDELARHLRDWPSYRDPFVILLLSLSGSSSRAEDAVSRLSSEANAATPAFEVVRAKLELSQGKQERALARLKEATDRLGATADLMFFAGVELLADLFGESWPFNQALHTLELTSQKKAAAIFEGTGAAWIACQFRLAQLYRDGGREREARRIENELRKLLAFADPDHPIASALRGS